MIEPIDTAPKDGTKILCVCSDGKTRYCWWFGCSDVDGCWMTEKVAEPVLWYAEKRLPPSLKEQGMDSLDAVIDCLKSLVPHAPVDSVHIQTLRRALEALPD